MVCLAPNFLAKIQEIKFEFSKVVTARNKSAFLTLALFRTSKEVASPFNVNRSRCPAA